MDKLFDDSYQETLLVDEHMPPASCSEVESFRPLAKISAPSNNRDWIATQAVLPFVDVDGDTLHAHNIRDCDYITEEEVAVRHYDRTYDLNDLESVDFIVSPFPTMPLLAHTMLSFGFGQGRYLVTSVEVRLEKGETYSPLLGEFRQYELMYVLADERDAIKLRTEIRDNEVYIYRAKATRDQLRTLLLDIVKRVNQLADEPEFYDTLTNNCTTNIVQHINRLKPERVPYDYRILLPGLSPQLAFDLGLLDTELSFEETQKRAYVNDLVHLHRTSPDFSTKIRR